MRWVLIILLIGGFVVLFAPLLYEVWKHVARLWVGPDVPTQKVELAPTKEVKATSK